MTEFLGTLRTTLAALAASDPSCRRFGASQHRYRLAAPLEAARVDELEREHGVHLPADYRSHVTEISDGGVGPYYGLLPLDHPVQHRLLRGPSALGAASDEQASTAVDPWRGVVALAHLGCGYHALLVVDGAAHGTVWLDARTAGLGVVPIADGFHAFYLDWILRLSRATWPAGWIPTGRCALPAALSAYLARFEADAGVAAGRLSGEGLRHALGSIPDGGIALAATGDDPIFVRGTPLDPCVVCAQLVERLAVDGLSPSVIAAGRAALSPVAPDPRVRLC